MAQEYLAAFCGKFEEEMRKSVEATAFHSLVRIGATNNFIRQNDIEHTRAPYTLNGLCVHETDTKFAVGANDLCFVTTRACHGA
jgi:hypothetical protein